MRRRETETPEYAAMVRRILRAYGRRVGTADVEDLADMLAIRRELDDVIFRAVGELRNQGLSWAEIARATGTSRQAAQQRWGH